MDNERKSGFAPIFPDTCYHLTHYWPAAADIPVASDNPAHYADAIRYNARTPLQGSLLPLTRLVWAWYLCSHALSFFTKLSSRCVNQRGAGQPRGWPTHCYTRLDVVYKLFHSLLKAQKYFHCVKSFTSPALHTSFSFQPRSGYKSDKFCTLTTVRYAKSGVLTPLNFSRFHVALSQ